MKWLFRGKVTHCIVKTPLSAEAKTPRTRALLHWRAFESTWFCFDHWLHMSFIWFITPQNYHNFTLIESSHLTQTAANKCLFSPSSSTSLSRFTLNPCRHLSPSSQKHHSTLSEPITALLPGKPALHLRMVSHDPPATRCRLSLLHQKWKWIIT